MQNLLLLAFVLGTPFASWAKTNPASWENVSTLQPGQRIQVVEMNSRKHSGTLLNVSGTAIAFTETTGERTIDRQDIRTITLTEHSHRLRNALIAAAIGAGAGAAIGAAGHHQGSANNPNGTLIKPAQGAAIGAVIGVVGGTVVGLLIPAYKTIYRAPS